MCPYSCHTSNSLLRNKIIKEISRTIWFRTKKKVPVEWMRYLDDCFINWDTRLGPVTQLHNILNELHHNIKFTIETNDQRMNFLDIAMMVQEKKVSTDIYHKPTDTNN